MDKLSFEGGLCVMPLAQCYNINKRETNYHCTKALQLKNTKLYLTEEELCRKPSKDQNYKRDDID